MPNAINYKNGPPLTTYQQQKNALKTLGLDPTRDYAYSSGEVHAAFAYSRDPAKKAAMKFLHETGYVTSLWEQPNMGPRAAGGAAKIAHRHYTVTKSSIGSPGGRYSSKSGPAAAAKKAASKRFGKGGSRVTLTVRQLGTDRDFTYSATRTKLSVPVVRKIKGVTIKSEYMVKVKSMK